MKILILHLSDAHLKENTVIDKNIVKEQTKVLKLLGNFDACFIIFSGDLANSGNVNEYKVCKDYLGSLYYNIKKKYSTEIIRTYVVPGNHDIDFNNTSRSKKEVKKILEDGINDEKILKELSKFDNFYNFARNYKCFTINKIIDVKNCQVEDRNIQFNLINSELFSTYNDPNGYNDKGDHYLPENDLYKLNKSNDSDFVITVSHRSPEWFNWSIEKSFNQQLEESTNLFMFGHDHINKNSGQICKENLTISSSIQGINFDEKNINFSAILVDIDNEMAKSIQFRWDELNKIFVRVTENKFTIEKQKSFSIKPKRNFLQSIKKDNYNKDIDKYFVFPGVEIYHDNESNEIKNYDEFLELIDINKHLIIESEQSSGKTTLLHKIYTSIGNKYLPLYLSADDLVNKKPENVIKNAFENQYGDMHQDYEKFLLEEKSNKIVLVDDLSTIKTKYIETFENYLNEHFGHIVSIVAPKWDVDIIQEVKNNIGSDEKVLKMKLLPFYSGKRLELIQNIVSLNNDGFRVEDGKKEAILINNFISDQIRLFSLSPKFINMYVKFCLNDTGFSTNYNKNAFGRVFENSIINNIRQYAEDDSLEEYLVLLENIGYYIHFNKEYPIHEKTLYDIIFKYNDDNDLKVKTQDFIQVMLNAKILVEEDTKYYFYNNSYLAYFVAKSINAKYSNNQGNHELEEITQNICFNINGDILLFLSYITSNISILKYIKNEAEKHMRDWEEFDIDKKNIGFILNTQCPEIDNLPNEKERKEVEERQEKYEKKITQEDEIKKENLYEYNENEKNTDRYKITQAMIYTDLICKILPGFSHRLNKEDKESIINDIYSFPNKIIYKKYHYIDMYFEQIVSNLNQFFKNNNISSNEEEIRKIMLNIVETDILNIYNNYARTATNRKTIDSLCKYSKNNTNYKLENIMMLENLGGFGEYTQASNKLYDNNKVPLVKSMLTRIMYKHFLYNKQLRITGNVESVARKYFGKKFTKVNLIK